MTVPLESEIQNAILLKYGQEPDLTLYRNNVGQLREEWVTVEHLRSMVTIVELRDRAKLGELIRKLISAPAHYVRYGLGVGSSDLIGIVQVNRVVRRTTESGMTVSRQRDVGVMLAAEVKRPGKSPTKEQQLFLDLINSRGGVADCVHSPQEFGALLQRARDL